MRCRCKALGQNRLAAVGLAGGEGDPVPVAAAGERGVRAPPAESRRLPHGAGHPGACRDGGVGERAAGAGRREPGTAPRVETSVRTAPPPVHRRQRRRLPRRDHPLRQDAGGGGDRHRRDRVHRRAGCNAGAGSRPRRCGFSRCGRSQVSASSGCSCRSALATSRRFASRKRLDTASRAPSGRSRSSAASASTARCTPCYQTTLQRARVARRRVRSSVVMPQARGRAHELTQKRERRRRRTRLLGGRRAALALHGRQTLDVLEGVAHTGAWGRRS